MALLHLLPPSTQPHGDLLLVEQCNLTILNYSQIGRSASMATRLLLIRRKRGKAAVTISVSTTSCVCYVQTCLCCEMNQNRSDGDDRLTSSHAHSLLLEDWFMWKSVLSFVSCRAQYKDDFTTNWKRRTTNSVSGDGGTLPEYITCKEIKDRCRQTSQKRQWHCNEWEIKTKKCTYCFLNKKNNFWSKNLKEKVNKVPSGVF